MKNISYSRRRFLSIAGMTAGILATQKGFGTGLFNENGALKDFVVHIGAPDPGNFRAIYLDDPRRLAFRDFLVNVYHLYPETEFHELILRCSREYHSDAEIYTAIQKALPSIKPFLADLFYSLPALFKQKDEISRETLELLTQGTAPRKSIAGYLEIGTTGRYISELKHHVSVSGDIVLLHSTAPTYSPVDIAERGGVQKLGRYIALENYREIPEADLPSNSLDVVANYIGFHHSPLEKLDGFVRSIARVLKPGGSLILRDHDVTDERMNSIVALAHDVFNAGLLAPWSVNHAELRNFRSLEDWIMYLEARGLRFQGRKILQPGDPTQNTLMEFRKV